LSYNNIKFIKGVVNTNTNTIIIIFPQIHKTNCGYYCKNYCDENNNNLFSFSNIIFSNHSKPFKIDILTLYMSLLA
jgi:hypothetical protein